MKLAICLHDCLFKIDQFQFIIHTYIHTFEEFSHLIKRQDKKKNEKRKSDAGCLITSIRSMFFIYKCVFFVSGLCIHTCIISYTYLTFFLFFAFFKLKQNGWIGLCVYVKRRVIKKMSSKYEQKEKWWHQSKNRLWT